MMADPSPSSHAEPHGTTESHSQASAEGAAKADNGKAGKSEKRHHPLDDGRFGAPGTSIYDYRRLNMRSTEVGMWTGVLTAGATSKSCLRFKLGMGRADWVQLGD